MTMSDPVLITLITTIGATLNGIVGGLVVWSGKRTRNVVKEKVGEVHQLVNNKSDLAASDIAALKGEVGRLNENVANVTPQTGGAVTMEHGQVVVSKEPEVK